MLLLHVEVPIPVQVVHAVVLLMKELAAEALLQVLRLTRKEAEGQVQEAVLLILVAVLRLLRVDELLLREGVLLYERRVVLSL